MRWISPPFFIYSSHINKIIQNDDTQNFLFLGFLRLKIRGGKQGVSLLEIEPPHHLEVNSERLVVIIEWRIKQHEIISKSLHLSGPADAIGSLWQRHTIIR